VITFDLIEMKDFNEYATLEPMNQRTNKRICMRGARLGCILRDFVGGGSAWYADAHVVFCNHQSASFGPQKKVIGSSR
jgi:hypothetical protein